MPKTSTKKQDVFQLTQSFEPGLNPKGNARLTFMGYEHTSTKDGERGYMNMVFLCKAKRGDNAIMTVQVGYNISANNKLGQMLSLMGCEIKEAETELDDEGFEVETGETDYTYVYEFLDNMAGYVYTGKLMSVDGKPGLYNIDETTLEPLMVKGKHKRDEVKA